MARVVFFGSPEFALPSLRALLSSEFAPVEVFTQPDRPAGRGRSLTPTPVRALAAESGIPVTIVESMRRGDGIVRLREIAPDYSVVVSFGQILPPAALAAAKRGNINVHASLLPAYRGASPVNHAIINGDSWTGVTTMQMAEALDAGPIYLQRAVPIDPMENAGALSARLALQGASLLLETLRRIEREGLGSAPQPADGVSLAPRLRKEDGLIDWSRDAVAVHNRIRGMNPWPGSFTWSGGRYLKVLDAEPWDLAAREGEPGRVIEAAGGRLIVQCGRGAVLLKRLQAEGRSPHDAAAFLSGFPLEAGSVLGVRS